MNKAMDEAVALQPDLTKHISQALKNRIHLWGWDITFRLPWTPKSMSSERDIHSYVIKRTEMATE